DDEEMARGLAEQHARAKSGMPGGPVDANGRGWSAERISRVLVYDKHPADYGADQAFSADVAEKTVGELIKAYTDENGVVSKTELAAAILRTSEALIPQEDQERLSSQYKMK